MKKLKLNFADWFRADYLWEFSDVKNMPTDGIELQSAEPEEFDEEDARDECERQADRMDFMDDCYDGVYDSPEDDPDFKTFDADEWEEDNPAPDREDFETDEEYESAVEDWTAERDEAASEATDIDSWREEMEERRERASECESEARWEWVQDCISEKEREHDQDDANPGDLFYKFDIDGEEYTVNFLANDPIKIGKNYIDKVFGITFSGPQGFSTTNKGKQNQVYTQLLLACKKLMEQEQPNVLQFTPAEPAMGLVYQQFVNMFLSGTFIQTSFGNYVRKRALMDAIKDESPEFKRDIYGKIMDANRQIMDKEQEVRAEKGRQREGFQKARALTGVISAVKINRGWSGDQWYYMPAVVKGATFTSAKGTADVIMLDPSSRRVGQRNVPAVTVVPAQEVQDSEWENSIRDFARSVAQYPELVQAIGQRAMAELERLVPELAQQLQAAVAQKSQQPNDLFNTQPPPSGPRGWSSVDI